MKTEFLATTGFLEITRKFSKTTDTILVSFGGNMGNRLPEVKERFEAIFVPGSFEKFLGMASNIKGSPDYWWSAEMPTELFLAEIHGK